MGSSECKASSQAVCRCLEASWHSAAGGPAQPGGSSEPSVQPPAVHPTQRAASYHQRCSAPEPMAPRKSATMVSAPMHMPPKAAAVGM